MNYFDVTLIYTVEAEAPQDAARKAAERFGGAVSVIDAWPTVHEPEDPKDHAIQILRESMQGLLNTLKYSERTNQVDAMRKCEDTLRATVEYGK